MIDDVSSCLVMGDGYRLVARYSGCVWLLWFLATDQRHGLVEAFGMPSGSSMG